MVAPLPANPLSAEVIVRTSEGYARGRYRRLRSPQVEFDPIAFTPIRSGGAGVNTEQASSAVTAALSRAEVRWYLSWARFPYYRVGIADSGWRVTVADARYDGRGSGSLQEVVVEVPGAP